MNDKRKELARKIGCPVDWSSICPEEEFAQVLRYLWFKVVQKYQWYRESELLRTEDWQPNELFIKDIYGPVEIESALEQIHRWAPAAVAEYQSAYTRFAKLRAATQKDHNKHYCHSTASDIEVADLSISRGQSVLYPRIDTTYQERVSWAALLEVWLSHEAAYVIDIHDLTATSVVVDAFRAVFGGHSLRVAMDVGVHVGCTAGTPSSWLLLDYHRSTPIFHAYPISPGEAHSEPRRYSARV